MLMIAPFLSLVESSFTIGSAFTLGVLSLSAALVYQFKASATEVGIFLFFCTISEASFSSLCLWFGSAFPLFLLFWSVSFRLPITIYGESLLPFISVSLLLIFGLAVDLLNCRGLFRILSTSGLIVSCVVMLMNLYF